MWQKILVIIGLSVLAVTEGAGPRKTFYKNFEEFEPDFDPTFPIKTFDEPLSFRLPNNTYPLHYDVYLLTDIHIPNFEFYGTVTIRIRTVETSQVIVLHYRQLNILRVNLYDGAGTLLEANLNFAQVELQEFLMIWPSAEMPAEREFLVRVEYNGMLRTDDYGFYRASYVDESGKRVWFATTQFQATDARHAFPCYDEPQIRTSFSISIRHHESLQALSNMPVESIVSGPLRGFVVTSFEKVLSMQTYLVAFTVSDFKYAEDASVVPPQKVYAKPESIEKKEYELALEVSPDIMLTCENYFEKNYTFPKMDQIAITNFDAGAMENWGLVSYREQFLLFDPLRDTTRDHENILLTISHEFVHQWIGNMVVMQWWTYLWLNEGFATLYEYYFVHLTYPEGRYDDSFLVDTLQRVLEVDANPNIRPMSLYVEDPVSIDFLFDWVAYSKSGSVLYMFMHAMGEETWRKAMQYYVRDRYDNYANPSHLYENLQRAIDEDYPGNSIDIAAVIETWEWQSGFPLLTVELNGDSIDIRQERFFYDRNQQSANVWWIPINYVTASNPDYDDSRVDFWSSSELTVLQNSTASKSWQTGDWIVFNIRQNFYYRVNYDQYLWTLIISQLNSDNDGYRDIHVRNRGQLIDDSYHLARGGRLDYSVLLGVMEYLRFETDYVPWVAGNRAQNALNRWLSGSSVYEQYHAYMRANTRKIFEKLGVDLVADEPRVDRFSRAFVMNQACRAQLAECLTQSNQKLARHLTLNERIEPEYVSATYCNGMRIANGLMFGAMQNKLLQSGIQSERNSIITGMGCSQETDLLYVFLNLALMPNTNFSVSEKQRILTAPAPNGELYLEAMINFTLANYRAINSISSTIINSILTNIAAYIGSESIFSKYDELLSVLTTSQVLSPSDFLRFRSNGRTNLLWQATNLQAIEEFFSGK